MKVAVIGGGAAGFFAAIHAKTNYPKAEVTVFEKSKKVLSKVKVSGGGRCNVTNGCSDIIELAKAYPRGEKELKRAFYSFNTTDTIKWFESRGVPLTIQDDNCVFPKSQDSQSIINCFIAECEKIGVIVKTEMGVTSIIPRPDFLELSFTSEKIPNHTFDKVIVTTGGSPKHSGLKWLEDLGHEIKTPVPSLFTFNMPKESITELMGIVVENTLTSIPGTKLKSDGPLLITHWGMSGPSILKLSAFGARILAEKNYQFPVAVNWTGETNFESISNNLKKVIASNPNKILINVKPFGLQDRLWKYLLKKVELSEHKKWGELGKKGLNKLINVLSNDIYQANGKTTFKDEFVTCGGVSLKSINMKTMQSKIVSNLYFAGEVIDIDGITGGYNFQAAWTTGFIAGKLQN